MILDSITQLPTRCRQASRVEWYSQALDRARREKRKCEKKWRATKLAVHKEIFREACDQLSKIIIASIIQPQQSVSSVDEPGPVLYVSWGLDNRKLLRLLSVIPYKPNLLLAQLQAAQYKIYKDFPQYTKKNPLLMNVCALPYLAFCSSTSATCLFTRCVADSQSSVTLKTHLSIYQSAVWS